MSKQTVICPYKLVLLGESAVGKSSLGRYFRKKMYFERDALLFFVDSLKQIENYQNISKFTEI